MARRKDHTREELGNLILDAAWRIVGEEGLSSLTARRIGTHIGYAPGSIYNVFPSMNVLMLHLNARTIDILFERLNVPPPKGEDFIMGMKKMASRYINFAQEYRPYWMALFSVDLGEERRAEVWYDDKIQNLFNPLEGLLQVKNQGGNAKNVSDDARILWSSVHGLVYLALTGKLPLKDGSRTLEGMIGRLIETYVSGLESKNR
ncbi:MAG TPA: TetR/AcrR family transcriptional regulator [Alphaproteobacteria bacterium]|nr:TetR/AcrR family transcriptional regulator [Alphaproteobacteria bacterium]HNS44716.1 TetR/AcrR family transcriptional regulator [Alphaproteobacteria bacterium]